MWSADLEGGAATAEVGVHFLGDVLVRGFEVAFQDPCLLSVSALSRRVVGRPLRIAECVPVFS